MYTTEGGTPITVLDYNKVDVARKTLRRSLVQLNGEDAISQLFVSRTTADNNFLFLVPLLTTTFTTTVCLATPARMATLHIFTNLTRTTNRTRSTPPSHSGAPRHPSQLAGNYRLYLRSMTTTLMTTTLTTTNINHPCPRNRHHPKPHISNSSPHPLTRQPLPA